MHPSAVVAGLAVSLLTACGSGSDSTPLLRAAPTHYLLTLDELQTPDFTVAQPIHDVSASTLSDGDGALAQVLRADGFGTAASITFLRQADLATSNGPLEVIATVESFSSTAGAHDAYARDVQRLDAFAGAVPTSTGPLGDEAHADSLVSNAPGGIPVVQITIEWRVSNLVDVLVVRGRYGATRLDDALPLAHAMSARK